MGIFSVSFDPRSPGVERLAERITAGGSEIVHAVGQRNPGGYPGRTVPDQVREQGVVRQCGEGKPQDIIVDDPSSGLILFDIGVAHKQLSLSLFEEPPHCKPQGILKNQMRKQKGFEAMR
ncbi:hypothetical protein V6N11_034984 [Hibiscus sabdariffa]|uniref:Uncharacterized protein n=1 Tax=Hibiscus sabdariffa TaxID=183260 RepID=A0ABR2QZH5_9ROSI